MSINSSAISKYTRLSELLKEGNFQEAVGLSGEMVAEVREAMKVTNSMSNQFDTLLGFWICRLRALLKAGEYQAAFDCRLKEMAVGFRFDYRRHAELMSLIEFLGAQAARHLNLPYEVKRMGEAAAQLAMGANFTRHSEGTTTALGAHQLLVDLNREDLGRNIAATLLAGAYVKPDGTGIFSDEQWKSGDQVGAPLLVELSFRFHRAGGDERLKRNLAAMLLDLHTEFPHLYYHTYDPDPSLGMVQVFTSHEFRGYLPHDIVKQWESSEVLSAAIDEGDLPKLRSLLAEGWDPNGGTLPLKWTALHRASQTGNVELVRSLIENGAVVDQSALSGGNALAIACEENHHALAKYLLSLGANPNHVGLNGSSHLDKCATFAAHECAELLLDHGAKIDSHDGNGNTPLMEATGKGDLKMIELLLSKGANINHRGYLGNTPLIVAASDGSIEIMKLLLKAGADPKIQNYQGISALDFAIRNGMEDAENLLKAA